MTEKTYTLKEIRELVTHEICLWCSAYKPGKICTHQCETAFVLNTIDAAAELKEGDTMK